MKRRIALACLIVCVARAGAREQLCAQAPQADQAAVRLSPNAIQIQLLERAAVEADGITLRDVLARLSAQQGVPIRLDEAALKRTKFDPQTRIRLKLANLTLSATLRRILDRKGLRHVVGDGEIVITDAEGADEVSKHVARLVEVEGGAVGVRQGAPEAAPAENRVAQEKAAAAMRAKAARRAPNAEVNGRAAGRFVVQGDGAAQLRPMLAIERRFLRKVCELTPDQEAELRKREVAHLREVTLKYRAMITKLQLGAWKPADGSTDPRRFVLDVLASEDGSALSEDQLARYREEAGLRAAARRSAAARCIVAVLDERVVLSVAQRENILESLMANWNDAWAMSLQLIHPGNEQIPEIPNNLVEPFLSAAQRKAWGSLPKGRIIVNEVQILGLPLQEFANEVEGEAVAPVRNARPARAGKDVPE